MLGAHAATRLVDPETITPPHEVTDAAKVGALIAALRDGEGLPPIYVLDGGRAISGTHRLAAYQHVGWRVPTIRVTERQYTDAVRATGQDLLAGGLDLWAVEACLFVRAPKQQS